MLKGTGYNHMQQRLELIPQSSLASQALWNSAALAGHV
jgi:hypothetical protein